MEDLPRDVLQASRVHNKKAFVYSIPRNSSDPLQDVVVKFKEQSGLPDQFIQSIRLVADPNIILFNMTPLNDLEQFCAKQVWWIVM